MKIKKMRRENIMKSKSQAKISKMNSKTKKQAGKMIERMIEKVIKKMIEKMIEKVIKKMTRKIKVNKEEMKSQNPKINRTDSNRNKIKIKMMKSPMTIICLMTRYL
jgi:ribosomal protein L13